MTTQYQKTNHTLPSDVKARVAELWTSLDRKDFAELKCGYATALRNEGWTLQSVADLFGVSREMVRQMVVKTEKALADSVVKKYDLVVPSLPEKERRTTSTRVFIEPSPETLARLLELQPMAQSVRSFSKAYRVEAEEYTALLNYSHTVEGVTLYRLAKRLGVTHGALRFRLARYGYKMPANGSSRVYQAVLEKNRVR
jgi:plasmid maintenance system antidote protein VapI